MGKETCELQSFASTLTTLDVADRSPTWREKVISVGPNAAEAFILPLVASMEAPSGKSEVTENEADVQSKVAHNAKSLTENSKS